jgi:hypothetical protein
MASTTENRSTGTSRRALLAGAVGGLGVLAARAIGSPSPARAEGEAIVVGGEYTDATSKTYLKNQANGDIVFAAESTSNGVGMYGLSHDGIGVYGASSTYIGVFG